MDDGAHDGVLTVLLVGGYGSFGHRIVDLLADEGGLRILVAGRSLAKAEAACRRTATADLVPALFDLEGDLDAGLAALAPDLVVDAAGPYQAYGDDAYRLARAALARGIAYLDLADGRAFVCGIGALDRAARAAGVTVLSGVSTVPALTVAVLDDIGADIVDVATVDCGITPSGRIAMGTSVVRAIASYAGKRTVMRIDGRWRHRHCLTDGVWHTVGVPGAVPLTARRFASVDVPDLELLPARYPSVRSVRFGVGAQPALGHWAIRLAAWLVRLRLLPSLAPFGGLMQKAGALMAWGEPRGGMFVRVSGRDADGPVTREWALTADGDAGPNIPAIPVAALIRRWRDGARPQPGARPCTGELTLADFASFFDRLGIETGTHERRPGDNARPLYRRILGPAWQRLPEPVRRMHDIAEPVIARGEADIERAGGIVGRFAAALFGFPAAGEAVPVSVSFTPRDDGEVWRRRFAGRPMRSTQHEGSGRNAGLLVERFGPLAFGLAVVASADGVHLVLRRWTLAGLPLPLRLAPRATGRERVDAAGRFTFAVEIGLPLIGTVVRYRGWLKPEAVSGRSGAAA